MSEVFTEVTHETWGGRMKNSCGGVCFGFLLLCGSVPLLVWNEGRSLRRFQTLSEGTKVVVPVQSENINSSREGSLVHFSGTAHAGSSVVDPQFGISAKGALKLRRDVDMYQWVEHKDSETRKKTGGGTETTTRYSYSREWRSGNVDSNGFYKQDGHYNPPLSIGSFETAADPVTVGAFSMPSDLVNMISWYSPLLPSSLSTVGIRDESLRARAHVHGGGFYVGTDPQHPTVGDMRVDFEIVPEGPVSVLARQTGSTLSPYSTKAGKGSIFILKRGNFSAEEMFQQANQENRAASWILRGVGFLVMFVGFQLVAGPLSVAADILPCIGDMVECGTSLVSFALALIFSVIVIALGWIAYRPILALSGVAVGGGLLGVMVWFRRQQKNKEKFSPESSPILPIAQPVGTTYTSNEPIVAQPIGTTYDEDIVVKPVPLPPNV